MLCDFDFDRNLFSERTLKEECGYTLEELVPQGAIKAEVDCPPNMGDIVTFRTNFPNISLRGNIVSKELNLVEPKNIHYSYDVSLYSVDC